MASLTIRHAPLAYPPDRCWIATVTSRSGMYRSWRPTYGEVLELGLEDLAWQAEEERRLARLDVILAGLATNEPEEAAT